MSTNATSRARSRPTWSSTWSTIRSRLLLCRRAAQQGCTVIRGLEMFIEQAVAQFEIWTGDSAPRAVMERAALDALGMARPPQRMCDLRGSSRLDQILVTAQPGGAVRVPIGTLALQANRSRLPVRTRDGCTAMIPASPILRSAATAKSGVNIFRYGA